LSPVKTQAAPAAPSGGLGARTGSLDRRVTVRNRPGGLSFPCAAAAAPYRLRRRENYLPVAQAQRSGFCAAGTEQRVNCLSEQKRVQHLPRFIGSCCPDRRLWPDLKGFAFRARAATGPTVPAGAAEASAVAKASWPAEPFSLFQESALPACDVPVIPL